MKRVVAISDLHCGHFAGLTPPGFRSQRPEWRKLEKQLWDFYAKTIDALKPIDVLFVAGDCADGKGKRSGGVELIAADLDYQISMAQAAIEYAEAKTVIMATGTPYHVDNDGQQVEMVLAERLGAHIGGHPFAEVKVGKRKWIFDLKHKVGSSSIPHGRFTALAKSKLWNQLWSQMSDQPNADFILRGHVHYHGDCGSPGWRAMTLPALQGPGSRFGVEQCEGLVHFGLVHFDLWEEKRHWESHTLEFRDTAQIIKC